MVLIAALLVVVMVSSATSCRSSGSDDEPRPSPRPFPSPRSTGVPPGWVPARSVTGDVRVSIAGTILQDVRISGGDLLILAANVTVRRVEILGGRIDNFVGDRCQGGLLIEDTSLLIGPDEITTASTPPAVQAAGYTARRVKIDGRPEGFRVGGSASADCGPTLIEDSFARVVSPARCGDWHGDGIQGYGAPMLEVRNVTLELIEADQCGGTAPFFYPADQGNTSVVIDRLLVVGGGYPFRLGTAGSVTGLKIVDQAWSYGPIDVDCSLLSGWDAQIVTIDTNYQPTAVIRDQGCGR